MTAQDFAHRVLSDLKQLDTRAGFLSFRARGKEAVIGFEDEGEWVPLFRITGGSAAYNVAHLQVRQRTTWKPTFIKGPPKAIANELAGSLRFLWEATLAFTPA